MYMCMYVHIYDVKYMYMYILEDDFEASSLSPHNAPMHRRLSPGLNHNAVRLQLESLLLNPGLDPAMVTVMYDEKFDEPKLLTKLFNFKSEPLPSSTKYVGQ